MLTFDEATHTYRWNGAVVPGVTSVLKPISGYDRIPARVLQAASERGRAVHLACQYDDEDDLDEDGMPEWMRPYLTAWRRFRADHATEWTHIEAPGYHRKLGFAGTPDRVGLVEGRQSVVDIKTTAELMPAVGPQLAAYAAIHEDTHGTPPAALMDRWGVQLKADGTYHALRYTDPQDWPVFCSLLTLRAWCANHRIDTPNLDQ